MALSDSRVQVLPPFILAQRCYFANPMEYCSPSIEGALLCARNITALLLKSLVRPLPVVRVISGVAPSLTNQLSGGFDAPAHLADVVVVGSGLSGLTTALRVCTS